MRKCVWVFGICQLIPAAVFAVIISGSFVSKSNQQPIYRTVAAYDIQTSAQLASATPDASGAFTLDLPEGNVVAIMALASNGANVGGYGMQEFLPAIKAVTVKTGLSVTLLTQPAYQIVLEGGSPIGDETFVANMNDEYMPYLSVGADKSGVSSPSYNLALGGSYAIYMQRDLPFAGRIMVRLDNAGKGYTSAAQGGIIIDIAKETAASAIARLNAAITAKGPDKAASAALALAQDLNSQGKYDDAAGKAITAAEDIAVAYAEKAMETYRKGLLTINAVTADGKKPAGGVQVKFKQLDRDFRFGVLAGVQSMGEPLLQDLKDGGFNFITTGVLWNDIEPTDDSYNFAGVDAFFGVDKMDEMGFALEGHSLVYFLDRIMPEYLRNLTTEQLEAEVDEHSRAVLSHYADKIDTWVAINEAHSYQASMGLSRAEMSKISAITADAVHSLKPGDEVIINSAPDWFGKSAFVELLMPDREDIFSLPIINYLKDLDKSGVNYDVIGQQLYNGGCITLFAEHGMGAVSKMPVYDLYEVSRWLERLAALGKPVHITELSMPSSMASECPDMGYWRKTWTEESQADYAAAFYTIAFGTPNVGAITWWDLSDTDSFVKYGGLVRADKTAKPALDKLKTLFAKWQSAGEADATGGSLSQRVFAGNYEIQASNGTDTQTKKIHVAEGADITIDFTFGDAMAETDDNDQGAISDSKNEGEVDSADNSALQDIDNISEKSAGCGCSTI